MKHTINITHNDTAEAVWIIRDHLKFMGELPGSDLAMLEIEVPPGSGTPPHKHASPEIFRVQTGEVTFGIFEDGPPQHILAVPGSVVTVPSGIGHNYINASSQTASMIVVVDQSMVNFFRDIGRTETPPLGPPSDEEISDIMAACDRHGIEILREPA